MNLQKLDREFFESYSWDYSENSIPLGKYKNTVIFPFNFLPIWPKYGLNGIDCLRKGPNLYNNLKACNYRLSWIDFYDQYEIEGGDQARLPVRLSFGKEEIISKTPEKNLTIWRIRWTDPKMLLITNNIGFEIYRIK